MQVDKRTQFQFSEPSAMSYDTTVNDALDPPAARLPARRTSRGVSRAWIALASALALLITAGMLAWLLR